MSTAVLRQFVKVRAEELASGKLKRGRGRTTGQAPPPQRPKEEGNSHLVCADDGEGGCNYELERQPPARRRPSADL